MLKLNEIVGSQHYRDAKRAVFLLAVLLIIFVVVIITHPKGLPVSIEFNASGCMPDTVQITTRPTLLQVKNTGQATDVANTEFEILDESGKSIARNIIDYGKEKDVNVHLKTGYYIMECGSDGSIYRLIAGKPTQPPLDLGSVQASQSVNKSQKKGFSTTNLVANKASYNPDVVDPDMVDAWGLANRPAGLGGHFWVTANKTGNSLEYVGDVGKTPLYQNDLRVVSVPGAADNNDGVPANANVLGTPTGVVFNPYADKFVVNQGAITAAAKFIFAGQDGTISAWTEQPNPDTNSTTQLAWATRVADQSSDGAQFFGLAITPGGDQILAADFGEHSQIRAFNSNFQAITTQGFENTFVGADAPLKPGDLRPWNVTTIGDKVYVSYAAVGATEENTQAASIGEENHAPGAGKIVVYNADGTVDKIFKDKKSLDAPWGITVAPAGFGSLSGDFLVANFGDGSISAFKPDGTFHDWVRKSDGTVLTIPGIWALLPGNGASLGAANAVYFTAGPNAERDGILGKITAN